MTARKNKSDLNPRPAAKARAVDDRPMKKIAPASNELPNPLDEMHSSALVLPSFPEFADPQADTQDRSNRSEIVARENASERAIATAAHWSYMLQRSADAVGDTRTFMDRHADMLRSSLCNKNRTVEQRQRRAHAVEVVSSLYTSLLGQVMRRPDALLLLQRLELLHRIVRAGVNPPRPSDEIEALMIDLSDLLAMLKDPCHKSMWKHRRLGIARTPESAMPLFRQPLRRDRTAVTLQSPESLTWIVLADRDALEWVEDPFMEATFRSESGDEYAFFAPAPNLAGDVPIRRFCRSLDLSRATEYHIRERRKRVGAARVVKEDSDIVGLYESHDGLAVNLEAYALDLIERRTVRWSKLVPVLVKKAAEAEAEGDPVSLKSPSPAASAPKPITPTEQMLEYLLAKLAADSETQSEELRREYLEEIEAERRAGMFVLPGITIDVP
jgi:hypothetical protein